ARPIRSRSCWCLRFWRLRPCWRRGSLRRGRRGLIRRVRCGLSREARRGKREAGSVHPEQARFPLPSSHFPVSRLHRLLRLRRRRQQTVETEVVRQLAVVIVPVTDGDQDDRRAGELLTEERQFVRELRVIE